MSQNKPNDSHSSSAQGGTGTSKTGTTRDTSTTGSASSHGSSSSPGTSMTPSTSGSTAGTGTATAPAQGGIASQAQEYGQKIAEAATTAKDYVTDKASQVGTVVGDKFKDLQNMDYRQVAEDAKQYARERPGQAIVVAAAAGFLIGLLIRGSRR